MLSRVFYVVMMSFMALCHGIEEDGEFEKIVEKEIIAMGEKEASGTTVPSPTSLSETTAAALMSEIEVIRNELTEDGAVECNITQRHLWDLCRPVLVETCRSQYIRQCRPLGSRMRSFTRQLSHHFPASIPLSAPDLRPERLSRWFSRRVRPTRDRKLNFSFTLSVGNETRTFSSDKGDDIHTLTETVLHGIMEKLDNRLRISGQSPLRRIFSSGTVTGERQHPQHGRDRAIYSFGNRGSISTSSRFASSDVTDDPNPTRPKRNSGLRSHRGPGHYNDVPREMPTDSNRPRMQSRPTYWRRISNPIPTGNYAGISAGNWRHSPPQRFIWRDSRRGPWWRQEDEGEGEDDDDVEIEDEEDEIPCDDFQSDPAEVCVEIADRKKKCEAELAKECPDFVAIRERIRNAVKNVFSSQHFSFQNSDGHRRSHHVTRWHTDKRIPPVRESIHIRRNEDGDRHVEARISGERETNHRFPDSVRRIYAADRTGRRGDHPARFISGTRRESMAGRDRFSRPDRRERSRRF